MVKYNQEEAQRVSVLMDPTRYDIVSRLVGVGTLSAADIAEKYAMSKPAVSKHLGVLKEAEIVSGERSGRQILYSINFDELGKMRLWLAEVERFWSRSLDRLAERVESKHITSKKDNKK